MVIDASGDADVCHFAGVATELAGELEPAQTLTTTFRMANVDMDRRRTIDREAFHALMAEAADRARTTCRAARGATTSRRSPA